MSLFQPFPSDPTPHGLMSFIHLIRRNNSAKVFTSDTSYLTTKISSSIGCHMRAQAVTNQMHRAIRRTSRRMQVLEQLANVVPDGRHADYSCHVVQGRNSSPVHHNYVHIAFV